MIRTRKKIAFAIPRHEPTDSSVVIEAGLNILRHLAGTKIYASQPSPDDKSSGYVSGSLSRSNYTIRGKIST